MIPGAPGTPATGRRCEFKACPMQAIPQTNFCANHQPAPIKQGAAADEDFAIIDLKDLPPARCNEVATTLLKAVKNLSEGRALKVALRKFSKPTLLTTQRYALTGGLRIGVRFIGISAYLWKLSAEEIKAAEAKAERMSKARKGKRIPK